MQLGFNDNVKHRGVLFHVQTEDSGTARPHVITHLYHAGTILASDKSSYAEWVEAEDLDSRVRGLMEEQHKAMGRRLEAGEFDDVIQQRLPDLFGDSASPPADESAHTPPVDEGPDVDAVVELIDESPLQPGVVPSVLADSKGTTEPDVREATPPPAVAAAAEAAERLIGEGSPEPAPDSHESPTQVRSESTTIPGPRQFGEGVVSDQPLDEVILSYLVESARKRKRAKR